MNQTFQIIFVIVILAVVWIAAYRIKDAWTFLAVAMMCLASIGVLHWIRPLGT